MTEQATTLPFDLHPKLQNHFAKLVKKHHLAHAYLFYGPSGVGKRALAVWIAQMLFCENQTPTGPCLQCNNCHRISEEVHPDVVMIDPDGLSIKVGQIRYLKTEFSKSGVESRRKVFIINDAEKMTNSAANSLLKFLEEPAGEVTAILLTSQPQKILPTILSRCQQVEIPALTMEQYSAFLSSKDVPVAEQQLLKQLTQSPVVALNYWQAEKFQQQLAELTKWFFKAVNNDLTSFVDVQVQILPLTKERSDQQLVLQLVLLLARDLLLVQNGLAEQISFSGCQSQFQQVSRQITISQTLALIEAILAATGQFKHNGVFQNVLEVLTLEIAQICHPNKERR